MSIHGGQIPVCSPVSPPCSSTLDSSQSKKGELHGKVNSEVEYAKRWDVVGKDQIPRIFVSRVQLLSVEPTRP